MGGAEVGGRGFDDDGGLKSPGERLDIAHGPLVEGECGPCSPIEAKVVEGGVVDGEGVEIGVIAAWQEGGEEDADDDAVGDDDDGLARVFDGDPEEDGEDAASDRGVGFAAFVAVLDLAGDPAGFGCGVGGEAVVAALATERTHLAFVEVGLNSRGQAAGRGDWLGGIDGAFHGGAVECGGLFGGEVLCDGVGLEDSAFTQADIGLGAVEKAGRGGFGVA